MNAVNDKVAEYKDRVVAEWAGDETAIAWRKYHPVLKAQLGSVADALIAAADPQPGDRILDLASGTGEPALSIARRVGPTGRVVATDLSPAMLSVLRENASIENVTNIETQVVDAHELPFEDASFDGVTSRWGVMFFVEIGRALGEMRRVLKPEARATFLVWGPPAPGTFFGAAVVPYVRRMATPPDPDGPGPNRYAEPGKLLREVVAAGFREAREEVLNLPAPFEGSPEQYMAMIMEMALPFRNMVEALPDEARRAADSEAMANLNVLYDGTRVNVTAPAIVVTALK